jgi:hypothetical protein
MGMIMGADGLAHDVFKIMQWVPGLSLQPTVLTT